MNRRFRRTITENTPQTPIRKRDTMPHKIKPCRDPVKDKLPGENNHLGRCPRLPNPRNGLQNLAIWGTRDRQNLRQISVSRLNRVATIRTMNPGPNILPTLTRAGHDLKQLDEQVSLPNKERPPPPKIPSPNIFLPPP